MRFWLKWAAAGAVGHFSQKEAPPQSVSKTEEKNIINYREVVKGMVIEARTRKETGWERFKRHSTDYASALEISSSDLETIEQEVQGRGGMYPSVMDTAREGFLQFNLDDEEFSMSVKHVCGAHYGDSWDNFIFAICTSNPALNNTLGGGTTFISVVPDDWHKKIIRHMRGNEEVPKRASNVYHLHKR